MTQEIDHLVKMANQIAENLVFQDDAVDRVADHLRRFWAPSMRQKIVEHEANGGSGLNSVAREAIQNMAGNG